VKAREPETQETFDGSFCSKDMSADAIRDQIQYLSRIIRDDASNFVAELFRKHGYFNGRAEGFVDHEGDFVNVRWVLSCYGLPNHLDIEDMLEEIKSVLCLMDGLAETWGDEGVFCRCRDRLRALIQPIPR
jgi:prenyltransferase beta subunit